MQKAMLGPTMCYNSEKNMYQASEVKHMYSSEVDQRNIETEDKSLLCWTLIPKNFMECAEKLPDQ